MLGGILSWNSLVMKPILKWEPRMERTVIVVFRQPYKNNTIFTVLFLIHQIIPRRHSKYIYPPRIYFGNAFGHTKHIPSLSRARMSARSFFGFHWVIRLPNVWTHAIMFSQKNNKLISFLQATACYIIGDTALSTQTGLTRPETLLTAVYEAIKFPSLCFSFLLHPLSPFFFLLLPSPSNESYSYFLFWS